MRRGVDFDGTLAEYHGFVGPDVLGDPIPEMVERVRRWLAQDDDVVIVTARAHPSHGDETQIAVDAIREWCVNVFGRELEVTCMKDPEMEQIWDDRAVRVDDNTGHISDQSDIVQDDFELMNGDTDGIGEFLT